MLVEAREIIISTITVLVRMEDSIVFSFSDIYWLFIQNCKKKSLFLLCSIAV